LAELVHLVREPAGEPDGALILNHGRATDERDLYPLLDELDPDRRLVGVTPGAPLTGIPPGGRHWYVVPRVGYPDPETFASSYAALTSFLDGFLAESEIGWERTVIGGFSMGAVMSYAVGLGEGRPTPAAILALSGFVPTVQGWRPELESRRGLPVLIHHGSVDPIIDVGFGRAARELLEGAGLDVDYIETEAGHWLPPEIVDRARTLVGSVAEAFGPTSAAG
jgi:phospholipase/carboxylesterase